MAKTKANGTKLKKAVEQFGLLENAVEHLNKKKLALEKQNQEVKQKNAELKLAGDKVFAEIKAVEQKLS